MNSFLSWKDLLVDALERVIGKIIGFLPELIGAIIVLIIGLIVASGLGTIVEKIIEALKVDRALEKTALKNACQRAGISLNSGKFLGKVVYWIIVIAFLIAVANILHLGAVSDFLTRVFSYLPNIFVAILIVFFTVLFADWIRSLVKTSVAAANLKRGNFLGNFCWWIVFIFGILTALAQLHVGANIIYAVIYGLIGMASLAGGLAFGLGGREYARELVEKVKEILEK